MNELTNEAAVEFVELSPGPETSSSEPSSSGESASDSASSTSEPSQEPESDFSSMEVISVEDLVDILTQTRDEEPVETSPSESATAATTTPSSVSVDTEEPPTFYYNVGTVTVEDMDKLLKYLQTLEKHLQTLEETTVHPMMETPFEEYTVTEGLLLLTFLVLLLNFFLNLIRRWF